MAIVVAAVTLKPLRDQVAEARRQTEFIVGNAPPTLEVSVDTDEYFDSILKLKVINWNRRSFDIRMIEILVSGDEEPPVTAGLEDKRIGGVTVDPHGRRDTEEGKGKFLFVPPLHLDGWLDRSGPPNVFETKVLLVPEVHLDFGIERLVYSGVLGRNSGGGDDDHVLLQSSARYPINS